MHHQLATASRASFTRLRIASIAAAVLAPVALHAQSVGLSSVNAMTTSGDTNVMISARSLDALCRPAPAGTAYVGGVAVELKNAGSTAVSAKGVQATLSMWVDNKLVRTIALSNPTALPSGDTAFAAKKGNAQVWYPITAQVVRDYMKARGLSSPPASIPVKLELDGVRAPASAKLDTVSLNVALANDATLCGFLK